MNSTMIRNVYAPLMPTPKGNGPELYNHRVHQEVAGQLTGYVKIKLDVRVALDLAAQSANPTGVKIAVMKQVANNKEITLEQLRILFGWAARKAKVVLREKAVSRFGRWIAVGAAVVAAELLDSKTMSDAFLEASKSPVGRPVIYASWLILTAHLFDVIPHKYDPLRLFWKYLILRGRVSGGSRTQLDG